MKFGIKTFYKLVQFTASVGKKINFKLATNGLQLTEGGFLANNVLAAFC